MNQRRSTDANDRVRALLLSGLSTRIVAEQVSMSKSAVARMRKNMSFELSDPKRGRPAKLSTENKRFCLRSVKTQKSETAKEIQKSLEN